MTGASSSTDTVLLHAAGSLRGALTDVGLAFEAVATVAVKTKYGPSGLLKDGLAQNEKGEVFASANMEHPQALFDAGLAAPVVLFARNTLCALVRPGLAATSATLLDLMLDPSVRVATSTPKADPSGDYAWETFRKAGSIRTGASEALERKALQLTGAAIPAAVSTDRNQYGALMAAGKADIFLIYRTAALVAARENPGQQIVALPPELAVGANYGMVTMNDASAAALRFALFILSGQGQRILASHGFAAPNLE